MAPRWTVYELEPDCLPPGTEVGPLPLHCHGVGGGRATYYEPGPADDVYALGVTAYGLATGSYPPPAVDAKAAVEGTIVLRPLPELPEAVVTGCPELAGLIRQMLSVEPSSRVSAAEVAQALERAAETAGPGADLPIPQLSTPVAVVRTGSAGTWRSARVRGPKLAVAIGGIAFLAMQGGWSAWWQWVEHSEEEVAGQGRDGGEEDVGTAGLAEHALTASASMERPEPPRKAVTLEIPKKPLPGQRKPPCEKHRVAINGGCWGEPKVSKPPCSEGNYEWKGVCYYPVFARLPPPTSESP